MYIFGGQVDNFYLGDIVAMDMKTSKLRPLFHLPPFLLSGAEYCCFIPHPPTRRRLP